MRNIKACDGGFFQDIFLITLVGKNTTFLHAKEAGFIIF